MMLEETNAIYAKKLKCLRINQFISQKDMAIKFGISQQSYGDLENGKTNFTLQKTEKVCKIFNISFDDFIAINTKQTKFKTKQTNSHSNKVLKKHYERLLLVKDIRIGELELENKWLKKGRKNSDNEPEIYVMV
jgi:DNA-binding XRE family transcriptional regulator